MLQKHILVVDDNKSIRKAVCRMIAADERLAPCYEAENGLEAIQIAGRERLDLIVMDMSMPVMNGLDATKHIKRIVPTVAIVLVSVHADLLDTHAMSEIGISALVPKHKAATHLVPAMCSLLGLDCTGTA